MDLVGDTPRARRGGSHHVRPVDSSASGVGVREFLTFHLGAEEYAIDIVHVQEIRTYEAPAKIANAPSYVRGVHNLRGMIIPVLDLRLKLGCENATLDDRTATIVVIVQGKVVGVVVDAVRDVVAIGVCDLRSSPCLGSGALPSPIQGLAVLPEGDLQRLLVLIDVSSMVGQAALPTARLAT